MCGRWPRTPNQALHLTAGAGRLPQMCSPPMPPRQVSWVVRSLVFDGSTDMRFSDDDLKKLIEFKPIGSPFDVQRVIRGLKRSRLLEVSVAPDSYGGGTASYFDVFC